MNPSPKDKIYALAHHNATVMAVLRMSDHEGHDWMTTLELMVLQLAAANEYLTKRNVEMITKMAMGPTTIIREIEGPKK